MIEVRSEADGSFTIPIRENAPHTLEARARGYSVQPLCAPQEAVFPGESVELVLCPLVAVPVDVRFSTDAQAPFAMIQCHRFAAPNMSELFFEEPWRAEDSVLYLGAGRWEIRAKHDRLDGGDVEVSEQCPLTLTDGVPHEPMRLSLRPMIGIRGSVRASGENTLPALHLVLAAGSVADPQTPLIDTGRPQCYIAGETRSAAFEFLDLNPGLYTLHVYYDISNARATSLQIMVKDRLEVADLTIPSPAFASGRRVRVLGPDGAPMDGCSFAMRYSVQDSVDFEDVTASRRRRGEYFVSWSLIPEAKLLGFSIRSRDAGVMFLPAAEGDGMLEARFAPPALVRVRIPKASQQYLRAQYQVWITDERLRERLGQADLIDHNGGEALEASIGPIQPGSYEVALWGSIQTKLSQRGENLRPLQRMSIDIASGENHLVLTPGQLYQLRVRVLSDSNVGAYEVGELRRNPEDGLSVEIDPEPVSENTYEYERVPPGSYHYIVQSRYGLLKRTVQIPGDGEQIVRLEPPNALLVSSSKMGSPVDAQLQEGDLIRAIDGVSITSMECKEACLTLAYNRPESVWRVERNGEILDVSLRLRGLDAVAVLRLRRMLELVRR